MPELAHVIKGAGDDKTGIQENKTNISGGRKKDPYPSKTPVSCWSKGSDKISKCEQVYRF